MAYVTGEVVANPKGRKPYKVVFRHSDNGQVIEEKEVNSIAEGEGLIVKRLRELGSMKD